MPRKPPPGKSLAEVNPEKAKEWHPTKNGELTPFDVTAGSNKKVWWKCDKGYDHEWEASIVNRNQGRGCPICSGNKVVFSTSLGALNPGLVKEWHPTKNTNITPYEIKPFSNKKVWWKCEKGDDHEWESAPNTRLTTKSGCPICSGYKVVSSNCLASTHPKLAEQWHPTKNGNNTPYNCLGGSSKKIWWVCPKGSDHIWETSLETRTRGNSGCPICQGRITVKSNALFSTHPELAKQWHPTKNGDLTPLDVTKGMGKKVWWKCEKGDDHEWKETLNNRTRGRNCPYCSGHRLSVSNSLIAKYPDIAKELHPTKNKNIDPSKIYYGSLDKAWWLCSKDSLHVWETRIFDRVRNKGCPYCLNMRVNISNCLATTHPELAKQWHPTKNENFSANNIVAGSSKKVWWKCDKGDDHEWYAAVVPRSKGVGCPYCTLTPQSRQELIITFELLTIFKGINPKGFKTRVNGKLWSIDTFIPSLNVGIEFDGAYWHKDKAQLDKVKTEKIEETGLNLIRVRQKPLERLFEDDVMAEKKFDGKQITNDILKQIVKDDGKYAYKLNKRTLDKIDKYLKLEGLQNEKGLDKYIDQILTEKAERKK